MTNSLIRDLRQLFPAWLACVLLPLPSILFWRDEDGTSLALFLFSVGCASLVAYIFRSDSRHQNADASVKPETIWRQRMLLSGTALFLAAVAFSWIILTLNYTPDFVAMFLGFLIPIPALCVVPFLILLTRQAVPAVVFTLMVVFAMKLLGCIVVVLVYGWHADRHGYTDMPWTHPNLLVWLFWFNTALLSLALYPLGMRKFQAKYVRAVQPVNQPIFPE